MTVVVVGDVMDDVLVRAVGPVAVASDTDSEIRHLPGGSGANQAAWLASLGVPVRFYGRVGAADVERHSGALSTFGVEPRLAGDLHEPTGTIVVLVAVDGERSMFTDRGANRRLGRDDLPPSLEGVFHLHVSGYALFSPEPRTAVADLVDEAAALAIPVSVDPSSESYLRAIGPDRFLQLTKLATIVFPNAAEARLLTGCTDEASAAAELARHYGTAVVKLGSRGAVVASRDSPPVHVSAEPARVRDTTGAGDAFCAGFLAAHFAGDAPEAATTAAARAASRALLQMGGRPAA
jgi:sugar/nucleoside kinase (ribokinase family)